MKKNNIILFLLMALPTLLLTSCLKDQEDLFSESASQRTTNYMANVKRVLTGAENGWLLNYVPDRETSYGGYCYTMKFDEETATVFSEFAPDAKPSTTSTYVLNNEDGPVLTFDTYNDQMHIFATPHGSSGAGGYEAYDGDFIFIIMDISEDENTITLKGNRSGNVMYMHRLTNDTPEGYIQKIKTVKKAMPYKNYEINLNGNTVTGFYSRSQIETLTGIQKAGGKFIFTYTEGETEQKVETPVMVTPEGIRFMDDVEILGRSFTGLKYAGTAAESFTDLTDESIVFQSVVMPLSTQFLTGEWYVVYSQLGAYGQFYWNNVNTALTGIGERLYYAYMGEKDGFGFHFASYDGSGLYSGSLLFDATVVSNDEVTIAFSKKGAGSGVWYYNNASFAYALFPFGLNARTFKLTTDNIAEPSTITLTDVNNANNVITLSAETVNWPFDK